MGGFEICGKDIWSNWHLRGHLHCKFYKTLALLEMPIITTITRSWCKSIFCANITISFLPLQQFPRKQCLHQFSFKWELALDPLPSWSSMGWVHFNLACHLPFLIPGLLNTLCCLWNERSWQFGASVVVSFFTINYKFVSLSKTNACSSKSQEIHLLCKVVWIGGDK